MWQYMAILELGEMRTHFYDAVEESPEKIVDDYYYDCDDDDLHDEWKGREMEEKEEGDGDWREPRKGEERSEKKEKKKTK